MDLYRVCDFGELDEDFDGECIDEGVVGGHVGDELHGLEIGRGCRQIHLHDVQSVQCILSGREEMARHCLRRSPDTTRQYILNAKVQVKGLFPTFLDELDETGASHGVCLSYAPHTHTPNPTHSRNAGVLYLVNPTRTHGRPASVGSKVGG